MPKTVGDRFLKHVAGKVDLVQELKTAKNKQKEAGQKVILHKMIKQVNPSYKFYRMHAELIKQLQRVIDGDCKRLIVSISPRSGKACAHETPVLTPKGWTTHGELRPGDWVFHPDGHAVQVVAISPEVFTDYRVRISNGDEIWCHGNHEWACPPAGSGRQPKILETRDLAEGSLWTGEKDLRRGLRFEEVTHLPGQGRAGRCIQVDSPDGLYLVGRNLTPTHNSELSSRLLPAAFLLAHPDKYVAICSYSAELAEGFSREARDYFQEAGGIIDPLNKSVNSWGTMGGGGCWAAGVGGSVVGRSANLIIADDTIKGREDADSKRSMEKLWDFYRGSLYTRLEPGDSAIVIVATRWCEGDLTGRVLEMERDCPEHARENWTIIDLPAISEDPGSRPPLPAHCTVVPDWREEAGIPLCPQRYDLEALERIRSAVGVREWSSQYQQRPAKEGGNMFSNYWWQSYEKEEDLPPMDRVMLSVDCTFTDTDTSDYVVGMVVAQCGASFYVLDLFRERTDINGTISMMLRMQNKHALSGTIIELAASGHAAYQLLHRRIPGLIGYKPGNRSKVARLNGIVPVVEAGNVFLPKNAPWLDVFLNEFNLFPAAKNDDMCDALAQCINYMNARTTPKMTEVHWGRAALLTERPAIDA